MTPCFSIVGCRVLCLFFIFIFILFYFLKLIWILLLDSGHGGQTRDLDGDEADGWDEGKFHPVCPRVFNWDAVLVIFPLDFKINGHIVDDVRFFFIFIFFLNVESFSVLSHRHFTANTWHNGNSFPCYRSFNFCTRLIPASGQAITTQVPAYGRLSLWNCLFFYPSKTDDWHCFIYRDSLM